MQDLESVGVLIVETLFLKHLPNLFRGDIARPFQQIIGHLGTAVGKPVERGLRGVVGQVLPGKGEQLRLGTIRREQWDCTTCRAKKENFHSCTDSLDNSHHLESPLTADLWDATVADKLTMMFLQGLQGQGWGNTGAKKT